MSRALPVRIRAKRPRRILQAYRLARGRLRRKRDRYLQDDRYLLQPARTDAVGSLLVFLNLLECEVERVAKLFLAHPEHHAAHADATADMSVDRIGRLLGHL